MMKDDKDNDFDYTRETLYDLINKGREGIEEMIEVARQSEHPRAYEVLAKLIKDTADTSAQLMDLHKKVKEIDHIMAPKDKQLGHTTNNNLFVGSTTELQRMLKDLGREEVVTIDDSGHDETKGE
ncbi:MAG: hypothetical protein VW270_13100 [Candidatus Poseidoniales archaeon]